MIKRLLGDLDFSMFAEISLLMFVSIFVVVTLVTLFRKSKVTKAQANVVFEDSEVTE